MGIALNIVKTLTPLVVIFGLGWYFGTRRKGSKTSRTGDEQDRKLVTENTLNAQEPEPNFSASSLSQLHPINFESHNTGTCSAPKNNQNLDTSVTVKGPQDTAVKNVRSLDSQNESQNNGPDDLEIDAPLSRSMDEGLSIDAAPIPPDPVTADPNRDINSVNGCQMVDVEKHDALILYADEDAPLARQLQKDLVTNAMIPDLNVALYEEFAPDVQSHFKTMAIMFKRCRYLLVLVTNNFTEASFSRYQNEIALKDSIENPSRNERVVPVWGVSGAQNIVHELSILKGIEYTREVLEADHASVYGTFKKLFLHGRRVIDMS